MSATVQELIALAIAALAALYLVQRLTGFPFATRARARARTAAEPKVLLGSRLARGLHQVRTPPD